MFEDWKAAWREAIENFYRELNEGEGPVNTRVYAMKREISAANGELRRLEAELARARRAVDEERSEEVIARRRQAAAEKIGDAETARLAGEYADRHARRALVLEQKAEALRAEHEMRAGDLAEMESALEKAGELAAGQAGAGAAADGATPPGPSPTERTAKEKEDLEFRRLDREARERAAEARLEELKKKMR